MPSKKKTLTSYTGGVESTLENAAMAWMLVCAAASIGLLIMGISAAGYSGVEFTAVLYLGSSVVLFAAVQTVAPI